MKKRMCFALVLALLLTACDNHSGEDIDLAPFPIETDDTRASLDELRRSDMTPFIMPQYGTENYDYYNGLLSWGDECVPGQLYLLSKLNNTDEAVLKISDRTFRIETGLINVQPMFRRMIYAVAVTDGGDLLVKIDQETGEETVLYYVKGKEIGLMAASSHLSPYSTLHEDEYLYFSDGNDIMRLDFFSDEVITIAESNIQLQELMLFHGELAWQDIEGDYFLHNSETGENVSVTYADLHPFSDSYYYNLCAREDDPEISDLYLQTLNTPEMELVLENITKTLYTFTVSGQKDVLTLYAQVGNEYIASANQSSGEIKTVYESVTGDMELLDVAVKGVAVPDNKQLEGVYVRDGDDVVRVDGVTFEAGTLFHLENGMSEFRDDFSVRENRSMLYADSTRLDDYREYYICGECDSSDLPFFIWADKGGSWFWYHFHSGVNEEIELIPDYWLNYYFIRQKE